MGKVITMLLLILGSTIIVAQTAPSASGGNRALWAGAEFSDFNPDYSCVNANLPFECGNDLLGFGVVADYPFAGKLGAAGEARWLLWNGAPQQTESSYLIGPYYRLWSHASLTFSAKILGGVGHIAAPALTGTYFAYAPGAD